MPKICFVFFQGFLFKDAKSVKIKKNVEIVKFKVSFYFDTIPKLWWNRTMHHSYTIVFEDKIPSRTENSFKAVNTIEFTALKAVNECALVFLLLIPLLCTGIMISDSVYPCDHG